MNDFTRKPSPTLGKPRAWCLFQSGRGTYAIALDAVAEVVEVERLVRLPHSPPQVLGLCTLRREVIPVIGLEPASQAGENSASSSKVTVLILKTGRGRWAFRVNSEGTIVAEEGLDDSLARPVHPVIPGLAIAGTVTRGDVVYAVIDPDATWKDMREQVENWYSNQWGRDSSANHTEERTVAGSGRVLVQEAY